MFVWLLHCKCTPLPLPTLFFGSKSQVQPIFKSEELSSTFLRGEYLHYFEMLFGNDLKFCMGDLSLFPNLFSYLITNIHDWTQGYLFYNLGYNPVPHHLFCLLRLFQLWPLEAFPDWLLCAFDMPALKKKLL